MMLYLWGEHFGMEDLTVVWSGLPMQRRCSLDLTRSPTSCQLLGLVKMSKMGLFTSLR